MENQELEVLQSAVKIVENDFIAIKPCCEVFGIDYKHQVERIKNDILTRQLVGKYPLLAADNKVREMLSLPKSGFLRWVYTLSPGSIAENNRQKFTDFLILLHDYLFGEASPARLQQQKQDQLYAIQQRQQKLKGQLAQLKSDIKDVKEQLSDTQREFWELFDSNALQTRIAFKEF